MGAMADMMLDGTLDSETGAYLGEPCGYPKTREKTNKRKKTHQCSICKKFYRGELGLKQHMNDKHILSSILLSFIYLRFSELLGE